jgi:beta-lactam-binding protein with PASTA domain
MRTRNRRHARGTCLLAAVVLFCAGCRKVPDLTGMTKEEALETLKGRKLKAGEMTTAKRGKTPGTVVDQDPKPRAKLPPDKTIALVFEPASGETAPAGNVASPVSSAKPGGPDAGATVPDVMAKSQSDAQAALTAAGLVPGSVETVVSDQPEGKVFYQDPPAKLEVRSGTAVNLKIAGRATVMVPNLVGKIQSEAEKMLLDASLTVGAVTPMASTAGEPAGAVITQSPEAGVEIAKGQAVSMRVKMDSATIAVPPLVGTAGTDALIALVKKGLTPIVHRLQDNGQTESLTIVGQSPAEGTLVASGAPVLITFIAHSPTTDQWMRITPQGKSITIDEAEARTLLGPGRGPRRSQ